jgi:prepilin-type N-terminal cleavage/methylation domain-containing protein
MRSFKRQQNRVYGFSLIELVIVVVIIAIIGAIAIPRLSRGSAGAADSALIGNLRVLRSATDLYATEHGGTYPAIADLPNALTQYSNDSGTFSATKSSSYPYGPYLRAIPALPVGANKNLNTFTATAPGATAAAAGWYYDATTGSIKASCADSEKDTKNVAYNTY